MRYKLRAECSHDVVMFINNAHGQMKCFTMERMADSSDVLFEFETEMAFDEIYSTLMYVTSSHVMLETVQPIADYTGVREYNLMEKLSVSEFTGL